MVSYKKWHHNEKRIWQQCQYWYIIPKSVKNNIWWVISMYFSILIILGQNKIMFSFRKTAQPLWLNKILSKHNDVYDYHNINTIMTALTLFWCFYYILWIYFTPVSSVSFVDFEQVNVSSDESINILQGLPKILFQTLKSMPMMTTAIELLYNL